MTFLLAGLLVAAIAALLGQSAVHADAVRKLSTAHQVERGNLVAALIARTPGEFAGLLAAQRKDRGTRKDPAEPVDPESKAPLGL